MSYPHSALSVSSTNPLRRSSGLLFVIALHLAVIAAINVGTNIKTLSTGASSVRVLPTIDAPKPPPIPREPFQPKDIGRATIETPQLPPMVIEQPAERALPETTVTQGETVRYNEPVQVVINAKVDPSRPLTQPAYPPASRRNSEQGRVELMLYILANGKVSEAKIAQSSGFTRLDESAMREAVRSWRFIPQQENGVAVPSWQRFAIRFRLEN